ncbi:MAG: DUF2723 domain-containing protein [Chloroflexota bacterium]
MNSKRPLPVETATALLMVAVSLVIYLVTVAPTVLEGDSGEFQFAAYLLGIAHPTGYPLYLLLGKLWTLVIPVGDVAYRLNLLSAVFSALAVGVLYLLLRHLALGRASSILAALLLAFSSTFWSQAVRAEVYALNAFFVTLLLYLALRLTSRFPSSLDTWKVSRSRSTFQVSKLFFLFAFLFGLSLTHHHTMLLLVPGFALYLWPWFSLLVKKRTYAATLFLFVLPAALYLYVPLRASDTPYLRFPIGTGPPLVLYQNTLFDFLKLVTGSVFRGSLEAAAGSRLGERLALAGGLLLRQFGWAGLLLGLLGFARNLRTDRRICLLLLLTYLSTVAFCLVYFIGDIGDLFTPSYLVFALWLGLGIQGLLSWVKGTAPARLFGGPARRAGGAARQSASVLAVLLLTLLPWGALTANFLASDLSRQVGYRSRWESLLTQPVERGAILVSNDRDEIMPLWYMQYVERRRPDLVGLFSLISPEPAFSNVGRLVESVYGKGSPVYLVKPMPGLEIKYNMVERGGLVSVVSPAVGERPAPQLSLGAVLGEAIELVGSDLEGGRSGATKLIQPSEKLVVTLYWRPLETISGDYESFVHLVDGQGLPLAQSDHRPGGVYYPTSLWQAGEYLRDEHALAPAAPLAPGVYTLKAGMYSKPSLQRLAARGSGEDAVVVGRVRVLAGPVPVAFQPRFKSDLELEGKIAFLGWDWEPGSFRPGEDFRLILYWRALKPLDKDYTVFVHVLDAAGNIVAQRDRQPEGGALPTSVWEVGEAMADRMEVALPASLPAGSYWVVAGMYSLADMKRLVVLDPQGQAQGDRLWLGSLAPAPR